MALTSCNAHRHYRAYLLENESGDTFTEKANAIGVERNKRVCISLETMRVGFLHRSTELYFGFEFDRGITAFENKLYNWTGGRDLWLITDVIGRDSENPFNEKRSFKISSIKFDQESFSFLPIDANDKVVFDGIADTPYDVTFRLYTVHGIPTKRALLDIGSQSIFKAGWFAAQGFLNATTDYLGKEIVDLVTNKTEEQLFWEKILLKFSAELEFEGSFRLMPVMPAEKNKTDKIYSLYDFVKSEIDADYDKKHDKKEQDKENGLCKDDYKNIYYCKDGTVRLPENREEYLQVYKHVREKLKSVLLPDYPLDMNATTWKDDLSKSYIKFKVKESCN